MSASCRESLGHGPYFAASGCGECRSGARFAWESASDGRDVTPRSARLASGELVAVRTGELEEHIVGDLAWAATSYLDWTGDEDFAAGAGRELLVETARYLGLARASRA